jgi:hypothetical protein
MQHNKFATGKKVYVTGSYAPSTGANKKKGYIAREFRRKRRKAMKQKAVDKQMAAKALKYNLRRPV